MPVSSTVTSPTEMLGLHRRCMTGEQEDDPSGVVPAARLPQTWYKPGHNRAWAAHSRVTLHYKKPDPMCSRWKSSRQYSADTAVRRARQDGPVTERSEQPLRVNGGPGPLTKITVRGKRVFAVDDDVRRRAVLFRFFGPSSTTATKATLIARRPRSAAAQ
uniref:Uncharacterized protein n=1 Tax=Anopheles atroparvus TaxID=41427 RepID=A0A182JN20_ANOAO